MIISFIVQIKQSKQTSWYSDQIGRKHHAVIQTTYSYIEPKKRFQLVAADNTGVVDWYIDFDDAEIIETLT